MKYYILKPKVASNGAITDKLIIMQERWLCNLEGEMVIEL